MKQKMIILSLVVFGILTLSGCGCKHEWNEATCTSPAICKLCEATKGDAIGHNWIEANCVSPKACIVCGETEGTSLGHTVGEFDIVRNATEEQAGIEQLRCLTCSEVVEEKYTFYYDITEDEQILYTNVLNTVYSIEQCLINPETLKVIGATAFSDDRRTTVCLEWAGTNGVTDTYYFWKDIGTKKISNEFGQRNYEGNPNSHTVKTLDLTEINYYANSGAYEKTIISSEYIVFK